MAPERNPPSPAAPRRLTLPLVLAPRAAKARPQVVDTRADIDPRWVLLGLVVLLAMVFVYRVGESARNPLAEPLSAAALRAAIVRFEQQTGHYPQRVEELVDAGLLPPPTPLLAPDVGTPNRTSTNPLRPLTAAGPMGAAAPPLAPHTGGTPTNAPPAATAEAAPATSGSSVSRDPVSRDRRSRTAAERASGASAPAAGQTAARH